MALVFVSSRFEEFATLRTALSRGVATASAVEIVNLDDGKAAAMGAVKRSISSLNECDVVVLLCGESYADWDEPEYVEGSEPRKLSTTHLEFRAAMDAGVPVLAYRTVSDSRDARLDSMLAEVGEAWVIGALVEDPFDSVDRILDELDAWASKVNESAFPNGAASFAGQLMQELSFLGVENLDKWTLSDAAARQQPAYVRLIEQRRFAMTSLSAGEVDAARGQLFEAHVIYSLDWATDYVLARLLEVKNIKQDQSDAREFARKAALRVTDLDHAPMSLKETMQAIAIDRRQVATLTLQARLARRALDLKAGAGFVERALERAPTSREALVERVRMYGLAGNVEKAKDAARDLLKIHPDRAVTLMRSEDLTPVQPDVEQSLIDFVLERHETALRALRVQVPQMRRPTRLRRALDLFREAHMNAKGDLANATVAVLALTELGSAGRVVPAVENAAVTLKAAEKDAATVQEQLSCTKDVIRMLNTAPDLSKWACVEVEHPPWAAKGLRDLRDITAKGVALRDEVSSLFFELRRNAAWPQYPRAWALKRTHSRPREPLSWALKEQTNAYNARAAGGRDLNEMMMRSSKRRWWSCIAVTSAIIWSVAGMKASDYFGNSFVYWSVYLIAAKAGLACALSVLLFLVNPHLYATDRKLARHRQSLVSLDERIQKAERLKAALRAEESIGARKAALVAELGPRRGELLNELVSHCESLAGELEKSRQLGRDSTERTAKALETHVRTTAVLGLDAASEFRDIVADLLGRYVRYNRAFAVFPNLTSRAYVPLRRAQTGDFTRISKDDLAGPQKGGFLNQAPDVSRRLVRRTGPNHVSDVGVVLGHPADQIDAFELCLSGYIIGPIAAAHAA